MRVVALAESESHVCCRYRLTAFRPALASAGHALDVYPLPQSLLGRLNLGRDLTSYDAIILQRKLLPRWATALLRRRARRLIFDFDDAVWLRDSYSAKGFDDPRRAARFRATVEACDLVIAGNEYLAVEARKFAPADRVRVIPTCVDVAKYKVVRSRSAWWAKSTRRRVTSHLKRRGHNRSRSERTTLRASRSSGSDRPARSRVSNVSRQRSARSGERSPARGSNWSAIGSWSSRT